MNIIFTTGLQGSGKSTWAKKFCEENKDWVRISRDDLRHMRGVYWLPKDEDMITSWEDQCIVFALEHGKHVIVDAMNLNKDRVKSRVEKIRQLLPEKKISYSYQDFTGVALEECIKRDLARPNSIGEKIIRQTYEKYLAPTPVVYKEDLTLPHCVIFDVDGTLAKMNGRSPYDWDRVGEDLVNEPVKLLNHSVYRGEIAIIIFTGRDGCCLEQTQEWLDKNCIYYDDIFIRPEGDNRKDAVVKRELFETHIRGKYYVDFVVDDRDQVVDMWRKELGLTCLQVDYGNF